MRISLLILVLFLASCEKEPLHTCRTMEYNPESVYYRTDNREIVDLSECYVYED